MSIDSLGVKLGGSLPTTSTRGSGAENEGVTVELQSAPNSKAAQVNGAEMLPAESASALDSAPVSLDPAFAQLLELSEQQYGEVAVTPVVVVQAPQESPVVAAQAAVAVVAADVIDTGLDSGLSPLEAEAAPVLLEVASFTSRSTESLRQSAQLVIPQPQLRSAQLSTVPQAVDAGMAVLLQARGDLAAVLEMPGSTLAATPGSDPNLAAQALSAGASLSAAQAPATAANNAASALEGALLATDPAFPEEFAARVSWMLERGQEQATLRLDPPRLGSITIQIALSDEVARVQILLTSPLARDVVDNSLLQLRQLFSDAGLSLADVNVSGGGSQQAGSGSGRTSGGLAFPAEAEASEVLTTRARSGTSMIDTFA